MPSTILELFSPARFPPLKGLERFPPFFRLIHGHPVQRTLPSRRAEKRISSYPGASIPFLPPSAGRLSRIYVGQTWSPGIRFLYVLLGPCSSKNRCPFTTAGSSSCLLLPITPIDPLARSLVPAQPVLLLAHPGTILFPPKRPPFSGRNSFFIVIFLLRSSQRSLLSPGEHGNSPLIGPLLLPWPG